ncbi:MAG: substrate-binding periplasmic protein [Gaiellales bacterium]
MSALPLVTAGALTLGCGDIDAMPLMGLLRPDGTRPGYEPEAAALVAAELGLQLTWVPLEWSAFYPALHAGRVDGIWCGQGITDHRRTLADFTRPYAVFNESLVTRIESTIANPLECAGRRIGAIAESTNMTLTETFPGVIPVPFDGASDDVYADMIAATRAGEIDGFVDDDVVMVTLDADPELRLAFTVETRNQWGIAVRRGDDALREALDGALTTIIGDGSLQAVWERCMPDLPWPLG